MRQNRSKPTSNAGITLPASIRNALVPAGLVAVGLVVAVADVPLHRGLTAWLDTKQQSPPFAAVRVALPHSGDAMTRADGVAFHDAVPQGRTSPRPAPVTLAADAGRHPGGASPSAAVAEFPPAMTVDMDGHATSEAEPDVVSDTSLALQHSHGRRVDHLSRAHLLRDWGDMPGALTECRRAIHDAPDDVAAVALTAELASLTGRMDLAVRAHAWLGRLLPLDARPMVRQARLLVSLGRHAEAVAAGEEAVLRDPEYVEAYQVLGRAHLGQGALAAAILRFQQAVHLNPEHGFALNNLGLTYLRAGENQKAAEVLARAAALLPHVAYVHNNLGVAHERLGRMDEARAAYAAAMHLSPRYVQARVNADRVRHVAHADAGGTRSQRGPPPPTPGAEPAPR